MHNVNKHLSLDFTIPNTSDKEKSKNILWNIVTYRVVYNISYLISHWNWLTEASPSITSDIYIHLIYKYSELLLKGFETNIDFVRRVNVN